jgi:hypothetical protein
VAPFFATAGAASEDEALHEVVGRLQEFRSHVQGGELTTEGIRQEAKRVIALKRDFVVSTQDRVFLDPYLDLARIDDAFDKAKRNASRPSRAKTHIEGAARDIRALVTALHALPDSGSYQAAADCLDGLATSAESVAGSKASPRQIRTGAQGLIDRKMECISSWPPVFGVNFWVIYGLLKDIDDELEDLADRHADPNTEVLSSLGTALRRARTLLGDVEAWEAGGAPTPSGTSRPTVSPSPSRSASASSSPSTVQTPTPEESPSGINPQPPSVSGISALFNSTTHRTTYSVSASDPDGDQLTFNWTKSGERECGTFSGAGSTAVWNHSEPPCPEENLHPGTIMVFVSDGTYTCSAFYEGGSASGSGPPADCGL